VQIDVLGANSDLHSGMYGGAVQNPIHALVMILESLRGADGRIIAPLVQGVISDQGQITGLSAADIDILAKQLRSGSFPEASNAPIVFP